MNYYVQKTLRKAVWTWYLHYSSDMFVRAANNLVLYTNINNITAFYRLLANIRGSRRKIPPHVKRMITIIHSYTKVFFDRTKKNAFEQIKVNNNQKNLGIALSLTKYAQLRMRSALAIWKSKLENTGIKEKIIVEKVIK